MGAKTGIEWTDATWNPIIGCSRVSEGCRNCYAEGIAGRFGGGKPTVYSGLTQIVNGRAVWTGEIKETRKLLEPLSWGPVVLHRAGCGEGKKRGENCKLFCPTRPRRIFVNSMSDLFHENVTDEMRDKIFAVMALCPQHVFQVLTKRPARMLEYFSGFHGAAAGARVINIWSWAAAAVSDGKLPMAWLDRIESIPEGLPNVWLGVSIENQKAADERIPLLLETPAAVRFISAEPLLEEVSLNFIARAPSEFDRSMLGFEQCRGFYINCLDGSNGVLMRDGRWLEELRGARPKLDWVICGGESGPGARPMHPDWARGLRDQCEAAGVPFFFKQWGEYLPAMTDGGYDRSGAQVINASDEPLRVGKHAGGAFLDRREYKQFPEVAR